VKHENGCRARVIEQGTYLRTEAGMVAVFLRADDRVQWAERSGNQAIDRRGCASERAEGCIRRLDFTIVSMQSSRKTSAQPSETAGEVQVPAAAGEQNGGIEFGQGLRKTVG